MTDSQPDVPRSSRRHLTFAVSTLLTALLLAALMWVPAPYVVRTPGPTKDVLSEVNSQPLITISDEESYDPSGQLLLTTVGVQGGPAANVSFAQVLMGWLDSDRAVYPVETVYPPESTQEEIETVNNALMVTSQENATYAALTELDYTVPMTLTVQEVLDESQAHDVVRSGDVLVSLNGQAIDTYATLVSQLDAVTPGEAVTLEVMREGELAEVSVTTIGSQDSSGARLGLTIDIGFDFPFDVGIAIDNIGGPSAGMILPWGSWTCSLKPTNLTVLWSLVQARSTPKAMWGPLGASGKNFMAPNATGLNGSLLLRRTATRLWDTPQKDLMSLRWKP